MALPVKVATHQPDASQIPQLLIDLGMTSLERNDYPSSEKSIFHVLLNGKVLGYVLQSDAGRLSDKLRMLKVSEKDTRVPTLTEICLIPKRNKGQFPGLYIFTGAARMMRPVWNLAANAVEYIGTLEQVYMNIAIR